MESQRDIHVVLSRLESLAPKAAEYVIAFLDMIGEYGSVFDLQPEDILKCFPKGLKDDQTEMIGLLTEQLDAGALRDDIVSALEDLASGLRLSPTLFFAMRPVFEHFLPSDAADEILSSESPSETARIRVQNLLYAAHDVQTFLLVCGFEVRGQEGSHQKWYDCSGAFMKTLPVTSGKLWLKNIIRELLQRGVSIDVIITACDKLKISYRILRK